MYASPNATRKHAFRPFLAYIADGDFMLDQVSKTFLVHGMRENMRDQCDNLREPAARWQCVNRAVHKEDTAVSPVTMVGLSG